MNEYTVNVQEQSERSIDIVARSEEAAIEQATSLYETGLALFVSKVDYEIKTSKQEMPADPTLKVYFDRAFDFVLSEAWRQWDEFREEREDCQIEDYHHFVLDMKNHLEERLSAQDY